MKKLLLLLTLCLTLSSTVFTQKTKVGGVSRISGKVNSVNTTGGGLVDFVTDTFTEAGTGSDSLSLHTGELNATWTQHPHINYNGGPLDLGKDDDRVWGTGTEAGFASGVPANADYQVCADFYHVSTIAVNIAVAGRMDTTADTMYIVRFLNGTSWNMRKIVATVATNLGTDSTNQIPTIGNFKTVCLVMSGDQISATVNGVTEIGPVTDSAITAAGRAGIRSAGISSASTGYHIDNFHAKQ